MKRSTTQTALLPAQIMGQRLLLLGMLVLFALVGAGMGHARLAQTPSRAYVATTNGDIHVGGSSHQIAATNGEIHVNG